MRADHLYVHVPFCARRCVYCDFSIAVRQEVPVSEYLDALGRELELRHRDAVFELRTLYFGGGTPSKLGGNGVARLMDLICARARLAGDAEVTLEANPEDVSSEAARAWLNAGITRVSLGVQSFDDRLLAWMHRTHDANTARAAVDVLRDAGISNVSIDIIFGAPDHLERDWTAELGNALALGVDHISAYGLTIEPQTPLGRWVARAAVIEAPEEAFEREFLEAHAAFTQAGFEHYEVSNYGRPGRHSRHNSAYWRRDAYAGIGPAAHEFDGLERRWNVAPYAGWVSRLMRDESPRAGSETLDQADVQCEETYLGLRTAEGVAITDDEREDVAAWIEAGWASADDSRLRLTPGGWLRLDALANHLTLLRSRSYI